MRKTLTIMGLTAGLLAGAALTAAAQTTAVDPGLGGSAASGGLGPSGITDSANGATNGARGKNGPNRITEPTNRLGPGGSELLPGGNGALGAGDTAIGSWTGTNPAVNRNLSGYTQVSPATLGSPSVARGSGPPPGVSR